MGKASLRSKTESGGVNILEVFMPDYKAVIKEIESVEIITGLRKPPKRGTRPRVALG
mgnify:CR=1 FL=1